ncbi:hypothetical protein ACVWXL_004968 [Bradyrhizobium sp. GM22.5]
MLNMMIRASGARSRMRRASSKPDTVGRLMSMIERSGRSTMKTHSPSSASAASKISISPSSASTARQPEATMG